MASENPLESYMKKYGVKLENNEFTYEDSTGNKNVWDFEKNCWVKKMAPCPPPPPPCPPPPPPCPPPPPPACPPPPPPACPPPPPPACPLPPPPCPPPPPPLPPNFEFDGTNYIYNDPISSCIFLWSTDTEKWYLQVDENFTTKFKLDKGAIDAGPSWFEMDDEHNTKVYVSNLPLDITEEEFVGLMQKCGLIMKDINSNKWKIKLYRDKETNNLKGDALCTYIKKESVDLALTVLDGSDFRGNTIVVERAKFEMKGEYNPALKPRKRRKKDKEKEKKMIDRLFEWKPEKLRGEREKHEKTVIIKNLFEPSIFDNNMELILEYTQDLREECSKCGVIKKLILHDKHPEGVAQVTFSDAEEADLCIKLLNNRWFSQRRITAEVWDGKTKYKIVENESEEKKRLENWNKFLEANEGQEGDSGKNEEK